MSYLTAVFLFGMMWLYFCLRHPHLRTCLLASGLLFLPAGLSEALFVPAYWNPRVIWRFGGFDVESLLFAFFTGGIASVLYPAVFRYRTAPAAAPVIGLRRHLFWMVPAFSAVLLVGIAVFTGISVIHTALVIFILGIFHMLLVRPDLARVCTWGAVLFLLVYTVVLGVSIFLYGQTFTGAWNTAPLFDRHILQLPLDEFIYALLFGGLWSTVYCGAFNRRFVPLKQVRVTGRGKGGKLSIPHLLLILGMLVLVPGFRVSAEDSAEKPLVRSALKSGYAEAEAVGEIAGSAEKVWAVLTDYEHQADYMPNVKECRILGRTGNCVRLAYKIGLSIFSVSYTADLEEVKENRYQRWRLVEGSFAKNSGSWQLEPIGNHRTRLFYHVRISHKIFPDALIVRMLRSRLPEVYRAIQEQIYENSR